MTCMHGDPQPRPERAESIETWRGMGEMDAVKAILLTNA
jgi:hypothetical protein